MATKEVITKVWIEEGCIVCDACETAAPEVFEVLEETCVIRPDALSAEFTKPRSEGIVDAAEECPTDVIKFETVTVEASDADAPVEPVVSAEESPAEQPVAKPAPVVSKTTEPSAPKAATAKASPVVSSGAGDPDPAIAALLRAAKSRGGSAGILANEAAVPGEAGALRGKAAADLPPDARQAKVQEAARKARKDPDAARRSLISSAALGIGWSAFGLGTGVAVGPAFARFMMPNVLEEPDPRVRVGPLRRYAEMEPGAVIEDFKPQGVWMIRTRNRIAALSIICTHLGCIPNWLPNDRKFKCPCHGSGYRQSGINFEGPTPRPLERFRLVVEDGVVIVDKSKRYQFELGQWDQPGSYLEA